MILNSENLTLRFSVDKQEQEIKRIQNAAVGDVLFTASTCSNTDVIETLLHESGIRYQEGVAGYTVKYYKV